MVRRMVRATGGEISAAERERLRSSMSDMQHYFERAISERRHNSREDLIKRAGAGRGRASGAQCPGSSCDVLPAAPWG